MEFDARLGMDTAAVARALGYRAGGVDDVSAGLLRQAAAALAEGARPRWVWRRFTLSGTGAGGSGLGLADAQLSLPGQDIAAHLAGCHACLLLAVTMGDGVDRLLRAAQAMDMAYAVVLDVAASQLVEQYANVATGYLVNRYRADGEYLTPRFSPGYGDFPLETQAGVLAVLNARRTIGLALGPGGLMLPAKSITAVVGVANHPVSGRPAGCDGCAIKENCQWRAKGENCGQSNS